MKLWEVMKELTEDPTKRFVFDDRDRIYTMSIDKSCGSNYFRLTAKNEKGHDISHRDSGGFDGNLTTEDDWQLVWQPITWQEAIQAWMYGKKVFYKYPDDRTMYPFQDSNLILTVKKIEAADWYVED